MSLSTGRRGHDGCSSDGSGPPPHLVSPVSALDDRAPGVGSRRWPRAPGATGLGRGEGSCPATPPTLFPRPFITEPALPVASLLGLQHHSPGWRGVGRRQRAGPPLLGGWGGGADPHAGPSPGPLWGPPPTDRGQTLGWPPAQGDRCGLCPPGCRSRGSWGRSEGRAQAAGQARGHSRPSWGRS